jgi:hypothetical protein
VRREVPKAVRQEGTHPAAGAALSCLMCQVVGPRTEARVVGGVAAVPAQAVVAATQVAAALPALPTRAVAVLEPARLAVLEPARRAAPDTTNPQLPFVT